MARTSNNNNLKPVIDAYQQWIRDCLIGDGSILSSGHLWTPEQIAEVKKAFVDNPDMGDDSFRSKLKGQMQKVSSSGQKLMAEMLWALLVFPVNITPETKRDQVRDLWSLSGEALPENLPMLSDDVLDGIGSAGHAYNEYRWRELAFLIELAGDLKKRDPTERKKLLAIYDDFVTWIPNIPGGDARQFRHMLRYVAFPDRVERIASNRDRQTILEQCGVASQKETKRWTDPQVDDALLKLRGKFQAEYPGATLDFYESPLKEKWQPQGPAGLSFTAEDCALFARYPNSVHWSQVSKPDQDLFKSIRERLKRLSESLVTSRAAPLPLKAETSHPTPNGRSPSEIWCCVYPDSVPNKSYGLQIALIISERGAELCFCQGSGTSQVADPAKKQQFEQALAAARKRLGAVPKEVITAVEAAQKRKWWYRKSWLEMPNEAEFPSLAEWLQYASSPNGGSASVSLFFTPAELENLGLQISALFVETLETFSPILTAVYSNAPSSQYWIFQGNPEKFDLDTYLRTRPVIHWQLRQYPERLKAGAHVLIWRSGENSGVIAECVAESEASHGLPDDAPELYLVPQENSKAMPRCRLKVLKQYVDKPIPRQKIKAALPELNIITFANNTNYPISSEEYAQILSLAESAPQNGLQEILRRYFEEKIVFNSSVHKVRYAITSWDQTGVNVERLDAKEPQRVTFSQAEKLTRSVMDAGSLEFSALDDTSAIRNTVLQAEPLALNNDQSRVVFLPDNQVRLDNFLKVLAGVKRENRFYKPVMLLCVLDGIETGDLPANQIPFEWIAPRFVAKMKLFGQTVTSREAAQPFYHLSTDLFWLHAVQNPKDLMASGSDGPSAARDKIKYALLKDTYWKLLQTPANLTAVRCQLETLTMPTPEELLSAAKTAIANTKFHHEPELVGRFLSALATKPFVILTGNSGTGKTKLAQLLAHWLCGDSSEPTHRYAVVPVGADWTDNRNVVGFVNHLRKDDQQNPVYQSTPVLDLLLRARADALRPYFLILDEMNLSHIERYFSDFLSAMESKKTIPLHNEIKTLRTPLGEVVPQSVAFPDNLFVIGTVNVDETTYMFSPKVLDRANVLEFRIGAKQAEKFLSTTTTHVTPTTPAIGAPMAFLSLSRRARGLIEPALALPDDAAMTKCRTSLQSLFEILYAARLEFAFRTIAEITRYLQVDFQLAAEKSAWRWETCMDAQVLQKILPKLHGSRRRLEAILIALAIYCEKRDMEGSQKPLQPDAELSGYPPTPPPGELSFPLSHNKLLEMIEAVRRDQFVSFIQ